ncbi:MAG: MetQ/NlpA family ABC transporter substrate-binding protein [Spirochaetaceae bacterium]|jgi:D-methionine transport system substrate-binding protein|nr:MetQ/NlpA family ABC transporter substrate-binding protein [Spirochaetaceae bacterium]
MKKTLISLLIAGALIAGLTRNVEAQQRRRGGTTTLTVGANPTPHGELLELVKDDLAKEGIELKIVIYTDYVQPNTALLSRDLDANYFQHIPYLQSNPEWPQKLSFLWGVHVEPYGFYSAKYKKLSELPRGATIALNNDPANQGRALLLLEVNGLIKLKPGAGLNATVRDITSNPKDFKFRELEAAQLPRSLQDVDLAGINGNYAIEAKLNPRDALALEGAKSLYVNGLVVRKGEEKDPRIAALKKVLQSKKIRDYIAGKWPNGSVVAGF